MPKLAYSEHGQQSAFNDYVQQNKGRWAELQLAFAIPNGAALARVKLPDGGWSSGAKQGGKLLAEGMRPGVLDWHLPVAKFVRVPGALDTHRYYIGLWLEFKKPGGDFSPEQAEYASLLHDAGHMVELVNWSEEAIDITELYLSVPKELRTQHARDIGTGVKR